MSALTIVILSFSLLGGIDFLIGNKFGIGKEFEKAFSLFGPMALSMLGMIVIAPYVGQLLSPLLDKFYELFEIDPSIITASLFANDMGGMQLSQAVAKNESMGGFNAFVVSSMMGCVISFTIPFSLGIVKKEQHKELFFGLLCGIVTIPVGCLVAGLFCNVHLLQLVVNLVPLMFIATIVCICLVLFPKTSVRCFSVFGVLIKIIAFVGLGCAIFTFLTKIQINPYFDTLENGAYICVNACVTLSGTLPLMAIVTKLLNKPLTKLASKFGLNGVSAVALLGNLVTNVSSIGVMDKMNKKGVVVNAAFAVSAAFVFGGHLAFTMAFDTSYVLPVIVGKLVSGACAIALACLLYKNNSTKI